MFALSSLGVSLLAISKSLASPTIPIKRNIGEFLLPDFDLRGENATALRRRQTPNYNQDYTTGGTVDFSGSGSGFSVTWSGASDFVVGRGWSTGDTTPITFSGSCTASSGTGYLTVYGWTTDPLIEYYIIESYTTLTNSGTTKGSVTSDGASYVIWENQRVNEPSIEGTSTFEQYISVRSSSSQRTSGTVTLANHFNAWAALGMNLGTFNFQVIAVEGWNSASGSAQQSIGKSSGTGTSTTTSTATGTSPTGSSGSCSVLYGQCGGEGWTGATCCASGSCTYSSTYYSQCLT